MLDNLKSHIFWKYAFGDRKLFDEIGTQTVERIYTIVRYSYLFFLLITVIRFNNIEDIQNATVIEPLWPVFWVNAIGFRIVLNWCMLFMFVSFLATSIYYKNLWLRISSFLLFFIYTALIHSFGKISHIYHLLVVVLLFFIFLPKENDKERKEKSVLLIASLQFFVLLTYTATGIWKLYAGVMQLSKGEVSIFSTKAMGNIISNQFAINNQDLPYFTELLINSPLLTSLLLWGAIVVECIAVFTFFKVRWHRPLGILLICMHAGIALVLDVNFYVAPFLLGLLFVFSPFIKESKVLVSA